MTSIKFKASVRFAQKQQTFVVLDTAAPGPSLKLAQEAGPLLEALDQGTDGGLDRRQKACVRELRRYGFLENSVMDPAITARTQTGVVYLGNPDRLAAAVARLLLAVPSWSLVAAMALMLVFAAGAAGRQYWLWLSGQGNFDFSWLGVGVYIAFAIPLHEFSHAIACRYAGMPVTGIGIQYRRRLIPTLFTNTKASILLSTPRSRAVIPLAGPIFEIYLMGVLGAYTLTAPRGDWVASMAGTVSAITFYFFIFNLNPFRVSDGANSVEELYMLEDGAPRPGYSRILAVYKVLYITLFTALLFVILNAAAAPLLSWIPWKP